MEDFDGPAGEGGRSAADVAGMRSLPPLSVMPVEYRTPAIADRDFDLIAAVTGQPVERLTTA